MLTILLRRFALLSFVLLSLSILTFSLSYLFPGNPLTNLSGYRDLNNNFEQQMRLIEEYKVQENIFIQFFAFIKRVFSGDLGITFSNGEPVFEQIVQVFPATLELAVYALTVATIIGIPLGIIAALQHKKFVGQLILMVSLIGYSLPVFWWALITILFFSLELGVLPTSGRLSLLYEIPPDTGFILIDILRSDHLYKAEALADAYRHMILPTVVLATYPTTVLIRFTEASMLTVLDQSYVKAARAKGLSTTQVLLHHGLRNGLIPIIRLLGLQFSTLITLAMITEVVFSWPGIGRWLVESIFRRDYPAIQGGLLVVGTFVVLATMFADLLYDFINPISRKQLDGEA